MTAQTSPSSSIIIVLTDGKLEVYPFELSVQEVTGSTPGRFPRLRLRGSMFSGGWCVWTSLVKVISQEHSQRFTSNFAPTFTLTQGWTDLILEVIVQRPRSLVPHLLTQKKCLYTSSRRQIWHERRFILEGEIFYCY